MSRHISFTFKQFSIDDSHCGMKVGTDGVALGAWAKCDDVRRVIDVGCGSGLIALMIAQRCGAEIEGIDIDSGACGNARENVEASPWCHLISIVEGNITAYKPTILADLIISNPPFFGDGEQAPTAERALARHEGSLNYSTLIDFAAKSLAPTGRLSFIYPFGREDEIIFKAEMSHLKLRRICYLKQTLSCQPIRTMFEFCRIDGQIEKESIAIRNEDRRGYSLRFSELCKDFYLELK